MAAEIEKIKDELQEVEKKSFAMELILNARNDAKRWFVVAMTILFMWLATISGFLLYLNQYDYTSTTEATGIYTAVDNSGNIIAKDVTLDEWKLFMEWLDGKSKGNEITD